MIGFALHVMFSFLDLGKVNRWNEGSMRRATEGRVNMVGNLLTAWSKSDAFYIFFSLGSAVGCRLGNQWVCGSRLSDQCQSLGVWV